MSIDRKTFDHLTNDVAAMILARADHDQSRARALVDNLTTPERKLLPEILWQICVMLVRSADQGYDMTPRQLLQRILDSDIDTDERALQLRHDDHDDNGDG